MAEDDEPRPGLIILDMSNDQMKDVKYNRTPVIEACSQLANSDFFHIVIDCKAFVPKFRQNTKGAKLVDGLTGLDHLKAIPKKNESALDGTAVLDTLKELQITHVCLCGSSTDTSIYATVKDLYENQFNIFVVRDAVSSKAGKIGHEKGLRNIESEFGAGIVVGLEDLLGEEDDAGEPEIVEEAVAAPPVPAPAPKGVEPAKPAPPIAAKARSYPPPGGGVKVSKTMEPIKVGGHIPEPKPVAPPAANPDGDVLAARKKQVEAARFADIEKKNKIAQEKAAAAKREEEERLAVQSGRAPPPPGPPPAAATGPAPVPAPAAQQASASEPAPPAKKEKKKSFLGGLFGGKKKKDKKQKANEAASTPPPAAAAAPPAPEPPAPAPAPAPPPPPAPAPAPPPVTTTPQQQQQSNAEKEQYVYPRPENTKTAPAPKPAEPKPEAPKAPWMKPQEKKHFPAYTGGARTTATPSTGLQEKMKGLQSGGLSMTNPAQRRMKTPKIVTDTKETWDRDGNITRHITRYITEVDGTKRTEKETVHIPAKK